RAAVTVPGSVVVKRQPGGYARVAAPDGRACVRHPAGAGEGCTQAKSAGFAGTAGPVSSSPSPEPPQAASGAALAQARAATTTRRGRRGRGGAVAVAGPAVFARIVTPAVVLRDPVMVMVMVSHRDSRAADPEGQRRDPGDDPPACSAQHRVIPSQSDFPGSTAGAPLGMADLRKF